MLVVLLGTANSIAIVINCRLTAGIEGDCRVEQLKPEDSNYTISQVNFEENNDSESIHSLYIFRSPELNYIPTNIADHFNKLSVVAITYTGLREVRTSDLKYLDELEILYLDNNKLESLQNEIFLSNSKLIQVNLNGNFIKSVENEVFQPLIELLELNFLFNLCNSDQERGSKIEVKKLEKRIYDKCAPVEDKNSKRELLKFENKIDEPEVKTSKANVETTVATLNIVLVLVTKFV